MKQADDLVSSRTAFAVMPVQRCNDQRPYDTVDCVAEEVAVAFVYNGLSHAVMMASPADMEDFAIGFSIAEGVIECRQEVRDVEAVETADGIELQIEISNRAMHALRQLRRTMTGRTGCGLCGAESLQQAMRAPRPLAARELPTFAAMATAVAGIDRSQRLRSVTGAAHAAALCNAGGEIVMLREDIGRHNALDKLIGAMAHAKSQPAGSFVVVSSRASYELVHKCCAAHIGTLVAVSAPTTLAMTQAAALGVNLVGFARPGRHVIYHRALPTGGCDASG